MNTHGGTYIQSSRHNEENSSGCLPEVVKKADRPCTPSTMGHDDLLDVRHARQAQSSTCVPQATSQVWLDLRLLHK